MNSTLKMILISTAVFIIGTALLFSGMVFFHYKTWMMNGYSNPGAGWNGLFSMMNGRGFAGGMMGSQGYYGGNGFSRGMMGNQGYGGGMMGGPGYQTPGDYEPLTVDETKTAVQQYLTTLGDDDLVIKEIMVFDNNAYAIISETSTGTGAFELLVDPATQTAFPEYGANMMWNTKYGMHSGTGMMGGFANNSNAEEMTITSEKAFELAQQYLSAAGTGESVSDELTEFYGYYTIDTMKNGKVNGMLSVNGYDGSVLYHSWHGSFIEMVEEP